MKLNNHGWGLKELLIMTSILLILLLIVTYYIYVLFNNLDDRKGGQYLKLEAKLQAAAVRYVNSEKILSSQAVIRLADLKSKGYIEDFTDSNGDDCNGYVIYQDNDYKSYISCKFFTSKKYNKNNE